MLKFWTSSEAGLVKKTFGRSLRGFRPNVPPHKFIALNDSCPLPQPEAGSVVLACGTGPVRGPAGGRPRAEEPQPDLDAGDPDRPERRLVYDDLRSGGHAGRAREGRDHRLGRPARPSAHDHREPQAQGRRLRLGFVLCAVNCGDRGRVRQDRPPGQGRLRHGDDGPLPMVSGPAISSASPSPAAKGARRCSILGGKRGPRPSTTPNPCSTRSSGS